MENTSALLVISFGTSYPDTRKKTLEAIEQDLQEAMPKRRFYRAWTSSFIRKKVMREEGICIFSPEEALQAMIADGITDAVIQPTHMLAGEEYAKALELIRDYRQDFDRLALGRPLLTDAEDIRVFAQVIEKEFPVRGEDEMVVLMGHGSACLQLPVYDLLNEQFARDGYDHMYVGTVEFEPGIEPVLEKVRQRQPRQVLLAPLLLAAGDHATNDMSGDEPDSWKNQISREKAQVTCLLKGLGEYPSVRKLYAAHALHAQLL